MFYNKDGSSSGSSSITWASFTVTLSSTDTTGATNALTLKTAMNLAIPLNGNVKVYGDGGAAAYVVDAITGLGTSGTLNMWFDQGLVIQAPGNGGTAASDITLMAPTVSMHLDFNKTLFRGYRRVVSNDSAASATTIEIRNGRYMRCGRSYDYTGTANRIDYNPAIGSRNTSGNSPLRVEFTNHEFLIDPDWVTNAATVCDFGLMWRTPSDPEGEVVISDVSCDGIQRIVVMVGDTTMGSGQIRNVTVQNVRARDLYPRLNTGAENAIYAVIAYCFNIDISDIYVKNVYDLHATDHNSNGVFLKAAFTSGRRIFGWNVGRELGLYIIKASISAYSELSYPSTWTMNTTPPAYGPYHYLDDITCIRDAAFAASYPTVSAIFMDCPRWDLGRAVFLGNYGVAIDGITSCDIRGPLTIMGSMVRGIRIYTNGSGATAGTDTDHVYIGDVTCDGTFTGTPVLVRMNATSGTSTLREVIVDELKTIQRDDASSSVSCAGIYLDVWKSAGQNTVSLLKVGPGCSLNSEVPDARNGPAILIAGNDGGSGSNNGATTNVQAGAFSSTGCKWLGRFTNTTIAYGAFIGQQIGTLTSALFSNLSNITTPYVKDQNGTYASEHKGTLTVSSGATTGTVTLATLGYDTTIQTAITPASINDYIITPPTMGAGEDWGASFSGTTLTITTAIAVAGNRVFGVRALNKYYL